jgi:transposase InsO family protein
MDFVTGLPLSRDPATGLVYDSILVIVDRFTKYALMIPFRRDYTAVQLAHVLKDRLIRDYGIPKTIISDRDKLFTSNYWAILMAEIGIKRKLSTAYYPQTDGQTERTNRTMKTYLKIYSNTSQDNWVSLLAMAQMAYNNKSSEATGKTPYFANYGKHPNLFERTLPSLRAEAAMKSAEEMKKIHEEMSKKLLHAQKQSILYVN